MTRLKAFSIHLTISAAIAASVVALMLLVWYAPPFFAALGGQQVLLILLGVDVVMGPLFTLIIFNPKKSRKELTIDLSIIALLQAAALIYGMNVVFQSRPVYVVYCKETFNVVTANMLSDKDIAKAKNPSYLSLPLTSPVYVYSEMPTDVKERNELIMGLLSGKDLPQYPQYYMPYEEHMTTVGRVAKPLAELKEINPSRTAAIDNAVNASGRPESDVGYFPLRAKFKDQTVLVGKSDGKVLKLLQMDPWPPTPTPNDNKK